MSNPKPIISDTDITVTHRGSEFVVAHRSDTEDDTLAVFAGRKLSETTFDSTWLFYIGVGNEGNDFSQEYYTSLLNEKFQSKFGIWDGGTGPVEPWLKISRFLQTNLQFDTTSGFSIKVIA